jgi:hypothetical protein
MASPHTARMAEAVIALAKASLASQPERVEAALKAVEHQITDFEKRQSVPMGQMVAVYVRDCWTCRYCGSRAIALPVLRVLSRLYPDRFPYHPGWKAGQVHPAYLLLSASLDHVRPGSRGGSWTERDNLVTACWPCNSGKADLTLEELGWQVLDETAVQSSWDGLTGLYPALWRLTGQTESSYHQPWLRALAAAVTQDKD